MDGGNLLFAFFRQQEVHVFPVVLKQVLRENGRACGVLEDVEPAFLVAVAVGSVLADLHALEHLRSLLIEAFGQGVGPGLTYTGATFRISVAFRFRNTLSLQ